MEKIRDYKKETFWGSIMMLGFMIFHLFIMDISLDGKFPAVWIGMFVASLIRNRVNKWKEKGMLFASGLMIVNYILFRFSIYIPNYIIFFTGVSVALIYYINKEGSQYKFHKIFLLLLVLVGFFSLDYYMYVNRIIKDKNFDRYVKKEYAIKGKIQKEDLEGIEELSLNTASNINNLEGIRYFRDLKNLYISNGYIIKDFSSLTHLSNLEHLVIWYSNVDKVDSIDEMKSLNRLEIIYPKGGKIDDLENFPNIKRFEVQGMDFDNLTGLKGPRQLERLDIADGQVITFDGIENFPYLKELDLYKLQITDISKIFDLEYLESIQLHDCYIQNEDQFKKEAKTRGIKIKEKTNEAYPKF